MAGYFDPNSYDLSVGITDGFGATINIINGGLECNTGTETASATSRIEYYTQYCKDFNVSTGDNLGCKSMGRFSDKGNTNFPEQFIKGTEENTCSLQSTLTGYTLYSTRDYKRCVCNSWSTDPSTCLTAVPPEQPNAASSLFYLLGLELGIISLLNF